jgi:hypothetical protein
MQRPTWNFASAFGKRTGWLGWIEEVVRSKGYWLGGNGYPCRYTAQARALLPPYGGTTRCAKPVAHDPGDILGPQRVGRIRIDHDVANACDPDAWPLIEVRHES